MNDEHPEDAVPVNAIATTALDEPAEYAGGERLYAVLFDADYDAVSLDANGDLALLVDAEQAAALRDQFAEIAAALEDGDRDGE